MYEYPALLPGTAQNRPTQCMTCLYSRSITQSTYYRRPLAVYMKTFLKYRTFCPTFTRFMTDIPLNFDGHLACLSCGFSVFISDIMSDVLRKNVGHVVQNVGHV